MQGNSASQHPQTARGKDYETVCPPSMSMSANKLMTNLSQSIAHYQDNLRQFQQYVCMSVQNTQNIKCKCCDLLSTSMYKLKENFKQFSHEWKVQLPNICQQFMDIVKKICLLYQQQIDRLAETNEKWEFSYMQLLKATNNNKNSNNSVNYSQTTNNTVNNSSMHSPKKENLTLGIKNKQKIDMKLPKNFGEKHKQNQQPRNNTQQKFVKRTDKQIVNITDYLMKIKQSEISLMREQITQLFQQQNQSDSKSRSKSKSNNKIPLKILTQQQKIIDDIKQFRLRTMSDQMLPNHSGSQQSQNSSHNTNNLNLNMNLNNLPYNKDTAMSNKNSQINSRKNSTVFKQQFWQNLKGNIGQKSSTKQNNTSISLKQRSSLASRQASKEEEKSQKNDNTKCSIAGKESTIGSRLQDLKRNMYKNKAPIQWRT